MNELATLQPVEDGTPLTAAQLKTRLAVIQSVMRDVMKPDQDFGVIPGTQKPTLYKPGAEKLCVTFRLSADTPVVEAVPEYTGDIRYRVQVPIRAANGAILAVGLGECSTGEEKYRWRRPVHENEYRAAPEDQRREKWTREGDVWQQVRVNPADVANTVLKMAHKRAYIHGVIMATAAGAIFTQDIEDLPEGVGQDEGGAESRRTVQQPQRKSQQAPAGGAPKGSGTVVTVRVTGIAKKEGQGQKGPWTLTTVTGADGHAYKTFDVKLAGLAADARETGLPVEIAYTEDKYGRNIQTLAIVEREPGAEG